MSSFYALRFTPHVPLHHTPHSLASAPHLPSAVNYDAQLPPSGLFRDGICLVRGAEYRFRLGYC
jgi:hypothetical protein